MEDSLVVKKNWLLKKTEVSKEDDAWITGLKSKYSVFPMYGNIHLNGKFSHQIQRANRIIITTYTEKQEIMLKLKYGELLINYDYYTS